MGAAKSRRKPGNPILHVEPVSAEGDHRFVADAPAPRRAEGTPVRLAGRAEDRDAAPVLADARAAIAGAEGHDEEREGGDGAGVPAPPPECATLHRGALDSVPRPEARFSSDVVDHRFERFDDRLGRLEADVKEIKSDIKELDRRLSGEIKSVEQRLARLEGVVSNLPSTWVMLTAIAASQVALLGFTFLILRCAPK